MKKFLFIAALALMAATIAAPSYGQTSVPEAPDIGMEILCTPAAQMESMHSPVMTEYRITACYFNNQDILDTIGTVLYTWGPVVRIPMLKPEDAPMPLPLYGMRLWRPPVMNESAKNHYSTAAMGMSLPHNIRNAVFLSESRQASGNPVILEL